MHMLSSLIGQFGPWLWFALAVVLFVSETIIPGVHFVWFGVSAGVVGLIAVLMPLEWQVQVILFALISAVTVYLVRGLARPEHTKSDEPALNVRGAQYIGRKVLVEDEIRNGRGKVRVGDTIWAAQGEDAAKGARVEITGVNGTVLVVSGQSLD